MLGFKLGNSVLDLDDVAGIAVAVGAFKVIWPFDKVIAVGAGFIFVGDANPSCCTRPTPHRIGIGFNGKGNLRIGVIQKLATVFTLSRYLKNSFAAPFTRFG